MLPKEEYTIVEAAVILGRSTEFVRQRLERDPDTEDGKRMKRKVPHDELVRIAMPGMTGGLAAPRLVDGVSYYTKDEITQQIQEM